MLNILVSEFSSGIEKVFDYLKIPCIIHIVHEVDQDLSKIESRGINIVYFGGGSDVHPLFYGEKNWASETNLKRDILEFYIFKRFLHNPKIKYVGICRGSQFLNVCYGGTLYQDLFYEQKQHNYLHMVCQEGEYPETPDLPHLGKYGVKDDCFKANSTHHQAVKKLGNGLIPLLYEPNTGVIEGFYSDDGKTRAVQSHPEFLDQDYKYSISILNFLFRIGE